MISVHWLHNTLRNQYRAVSFFRLLRNIFPSPKRESICFIAATRLTEPEFWESSPLGIGLKPLLDEQNVSAIVKFSNTDGLPFVYNRAIKNATNSDILVFLHDDIWLEDQNLVAKIRASLQRFDIIGIAGNTRISKKQPAWLFRAIENNKFVWDDGYLSGIVRHGTPGASEPSIYGPTPAKCYLLDGVLLVAKRKNLLFSNVYFDERFKFHFYDMDFCRSASRAGLSLGTWPIDILHLSGGAFGTSHWLEGHSIYLKKWRK